MYMYNIRVKSRHPSHKILRRELAKLPVPSVVRLGSTTKVNYHCVEINSVESIIISSDKKLMKERFNKAEVKTAPWVTGNSLEEITNNLNTLEIGFPIIAKSRNGSRGVGNSLIEDAHHLKNWVQGRDLKRYIFEKYFNYSLEYRLHVTKDGSFYACRKALKKDAETNKKWQRHIDNTVWYLETNEEKFMKPNSWDNIVADCVKALTSVGADLLSFDVKVQGALTRDGLKRRFQDYILIECNSASSMNSTGEMSICAQKYLEMLPQLIMQKGEIK